MRQIRGDPMIDIVFGRKDEQLWFSARGHAGAGEYGKDLVCAAATMLAYTLGQTVCQMQQDGQLETDPIIHIAEGDADISIHPKAECREVCDASVRVIRCGAECLAGSFPENVRVHYIGYSQ